MTKLLIYFLISLPFLTYFFYDNNPYKFFIIFGKKGSGKSSHIAKLSQYYLKKGYKVYTNFPVSGCHTYDPKDIGVNTFEPNSVVFCDEIAIVWNNRDYKNFKKCVMEWFKFQRKYKIRLYGYSQSYEDMDKALRLLVDELAVLQRIGKVSIYKPIVKLIGIGQDQNGNGSIVDAYAYKPIWDWKFTYLPRYYGLFTSFNPPELPLINSTYLDYDEYSRIYTDTKLWLIFQLKTIYKTISIFIKSKITLCIKKLKKD